MTHHHRILGAALACLVLDSAAAQDQVARFYEGKTIEFFTTTPAGSGIDLLARAVATHMVNYIPGKPRFIVRNMPGGGGVLMARHLFTAARKDGTEIGAAEGGLVLNPLLGINPGHLDMTRFGWLGSVSQDNGIAVVWAASGVTSIEDAKRREVVVGATGAAGTTGQWAALANVTLGTKFKTVFGYPGPTEINIAMERGEVESRLGTYTAIATQRPVWLSQGKAKIILQMGSSRIPELASVPVFDDLGTNAEDRAMIGLVSATFDITRPYMVSPDVPPERLAALRAAFDAATRDPAFVAAASKYANVVPSTGEELARAVAKIYATPQAVVDRMMALNRTQEELERLQKEERARKGR
jgi:tripartite-type tricarboxylate transporter receptor subunit TctC